jgi:hypothetical protein
VSYEPNLKAARARFVERIANAYFQTWAGYGFVGEEYSFTAAEAIAEQLAQHGFPRPLAPIVVDASMIDDSQLALFDQPGNVISYHHGAACVLGTEPFGDGVVGD